MNSSQQTITEFMIMCNVEVEKDIPLIDFYHDVFMRLLFNNLLMRAGFPPVILDYRTSLFINFKPEELLPDILLGMNNTFMLLRDKKLFGVDILENMPKDFQLHAGNT